MSLMFGKLENVLFYKYVFLILFLLFFSQPHLILCTYITRLGFMLMYAFSTRRFPIELFYHKLFVFSQEYETLLDFFISKNITLLYR